MLVSGSEPHRLRYYVLGAGDGVTVLDRYGSWNSPHPTGVAENHARAGFKKRVYRPVSGLSVRKTNPPALAGGC